MLCLRCLLLSIRPNPRAEMRQETETETAGLLVWLLSGLAGFSWLEPWIFMKPHIHKVCGLHKDCGSQGYIRLTVWYLSYHNSFRKHHNPIQRMRCRVHGDWVQSWARHSSTRLVTALGSRATKAVSMFQRSIEFTSCHKLNRTGRNMLYPFLPYFANIV